MPKTIAITPSWYWPAGVPRVVGVPPYSIYELCVLSNRRDRPDDVAVVDDDRTLTFAELRVEIERRWMPLADAAGERRKAVVSGAPGREQLLTLLAGLAAGVRMRVVPPGSDLSGTAAAFGGVVAADHQPESDPSPIGHAPGLDTRAAAVTIDGDGPAVTHSNRSMLAMALSMTAFLDCSDRRPWISTLPLSRWEGLMAALMPLCLGAPLILSPSASNPDRVLEAIARHNAAYIVGDLGFLAETCREAKRAAKDARGILAGALLAVDGPFDPDGRRRVAKSLECPALTFWGMAETGPVFASHPSWYVDESVGLPMTNAHVVPSDPRTGQPIQALWELVESAEVTVFSPALMTGYEDGDAAPRFVGNHFRTRKSASSDANGMIYLLGDL